MNSRPYRQTPVEGLEVGRLTILKRVRPGKGSWVVLCKCTCGVEKEFYLGNLRNGHTKSCGCLRSETTSKRCKGRKVSEETKQKIRDNHPRIKHGRPPSRKMLEAAWEVNRTRVRSLEEIEKRNKLYKRGSDNPAWIDGRSKDYSKKRKGAGTKRHRRLVLERDNHTCQKCEAKDVELHVHHIKSWANNPDLRLDIDNAITLCVHCHAEAHGWCKIMKQRSEQLKQTG